MESEKSTSVLVKIQNLCFPDPEICEVPELYYHETPGELLLDGWYNLIYLKKWKRYTAGTALYLRLRAADLLPYRAVRVYCDRKLLRGYNIAEKTAEAGKEADGTILFELPYEEADGKALFVGLVRKKPEPEPGTQRGFFLDRNAGEDASGASGIPAGHAVPAVRGSFCLSVPEMKVRNVNIGIDICTFRREPYVARNLSLLYRRLLSSEEEAGKHLRIYVIDNGQTLDGNEAVQELVRKTSSKAAEPLEQGLAGHVSTAGQSTQRTIRIFPNKNAGGAGGFTRGMLEILKDQKKEAGSDTELTHALLMDDDAVIDPESIIRIYGLLRCLKPKWKDMSVGGAMFWEDHPDILYCQGEYYWGKGMVSFTDLNLDMKTYESAADDFLAETGKEYDLYSGWWCCCYSLNTVREDNLPLPMFIHHDDIEYCLRNKETGMAFLNGVGVWHRCVETTFPGPNVYYDVRNNLIEYTLHGPGGREGTRQAALLMTKALAGAAFKMCYRNAGLSYNGFLDFLKGPERLVEKDPEETHTKVRAEALKLYPSEDIIGPVDVQPESSLSSENAGSRNPGADEDDSGDEDFPETGIFREGGKRYIPLRRTEEAAASEAVVQKALVPGAAVQKTAVPEASVREAAVLKEPAAVNEELAGADSVSKEENPVPTGEAAGTEAPFFLTEEEKDLVRKEIREAETLYREGPKSLKKRDVRPSLKHVLTVNGLLLPAKKEIALFTSADSPWRNFRRGKVYLYEYGSGKAAVAEKDWKILKRIARLWARSMIGVITEYPKAAERWKESRKMLGSRGTWEKYLGLEDKKGPEGKKKT